MGHKRAWCFVRGEPPLPVLREKPVFRDPETSVVQMPESTDERLETITLWKTCKICPEVICPCSLLIFRLTPSPYFPLTTLHVRASEKEHELDLVQCASTLVESNTSQGVPLKWLVFLKSVSINMCLHVRHTLCWGSLKCTSWHHATLLCAHTHLEIDWSKFGSSFADGASSWSMELLPTQMNHTRTHAHRTEHG